ncbi:hypothetical protein HRI_000203300 [Hibiscus trionum]|uniref:Uncharacterized protein n=1 Tax=Hibiscus trionum TaxID=183268 RepID=A0A9W7GTH2_HIBTR|nr:hypothetical protein HRI_000203300 [Hibiscus trionum]
MRNRGEEHIRIAVQDLISSYETMASDDFIMSSKCCIFKTPSILHRHNSYCRHWWPRWHAFYMHNYFGKPWAVVSQVFAIIILTLTALQTLYSIIK